MVNTEAVTLSIRIGKDTTLQQFIGRKSNARHNISRSKSRLLNLCEIVFRVAVKHKPSNWYKRIISVQPDFSDIKRIKAISAGILERHYLYKESPGRLISASNMVEEIYCGIVRILTIHLNGLLPRPVLNARFGLEVILYPDSPPFGVDPFIGMRTKAIHMAICLWRSPIRIDNRYFQDRFRRTREEVPSHIGIFGIRLRIALLRMDKIWKLYRITDKKDGSIITDKVIIAFFGIEFYRKTTYIAHGISRSQFTLYRGQAYKDWRSFTYTPQKSRFRPLCYIMSNFEVAVCARALGMDNTLRYALTA